MQEIIRNYEPATVYELPGDHYTYFDTIEMGAIVTYRAMVTSRMLWNTGIDYDLVTDPRWQLENQPDDVKWDVFALNQSQFEIVGMTPVSPEERFKHDQKRVEKAQRQNFYAKTLPGLVDAALPTIWN